MDASTPDACPVDEPCWKAGSVDGRGTGTETGVAVAVVGAVVELVSEVEGTGSLVVLVPVLAAAAASRSFTF